MTAVHVSPIFRAARYVAFVRNVNLYPGWRRQRWLDGKIATSLGSARLPFAARTHALGDAIIVATAFAMDRSRRMGNTLGRLSVVSL